MADAYGGLTFSTSDDCIVNANALVEVLNEFQWTNADGEWVTTKHEDKDTFWHKDSFNTQYPTTFPQKDIAVIVEQDDGELKRILSEDATSEDYDNVYDIETGDVELMEFSELFSAHITTGWIEIACTANEKNRYVYFNSLRVYANGKAERKAIMSGAMVKPKNFYEVYEA